MCYLVDLMYYRIIPILDEKVQQKNLPHASDKRPNWTNLSSPKARPRSALGEIACWAFRGRYTQPYKTKRRETTCVSLLLVRYVMPEASAYSSGSDQSSCVLRT